MRALFFRVFKSCLPRKVFVEKRKKIQDGPIVSHRIERNAPLDEADGVWVVAVGNDETNASFGQFVKGFGLVAGLVSSGLLEKIVEAPA